MFTDFDPELKQKALALQEILKNFPQPFFIACSGGLDSRFLAFFAKKIGCGFSLLHVTGTHIDPRETAYLNAWSDKHQIPLHSLPLSVLQIPEIARNSKERCYFCKKTTFQNMQNHISQILQDQSVSPVLCDGSHADDKNVYRPGLRALRELGIQSPLALANFCKNDIRSAGKLLGLDNFTQKARPCLLTRLPYDTEIDENTLILLTKTEEFFEKKLAEIFGENIPDFRVRRIDKKLYFHYNKFIEKERISTLQQALKEAKMPVIQFERLTTLSGYFDR